MKMTEAEVVEGITIDQFREGLEKGTDGIWRLGGEPLLFITTQEDGGWSSVSELTDCDMDSDEGSDVNSEGDDGPRVDDDAESRRGKLPDSTTPSEKRPRPVPIDEDDLERASKRARIQSSLVEARPSPQHSHPRLAAITNDPGLIATSSPSPSEPPTNIIQSSPRLEASRSSSLPTERPTADTHSSTGNGNNTSGRSTSHVPTLSKPAEKSSSRSSPSKSEHSSKSPESVVVISRPKPKPSFSRSFSSLSTPDSSSRAGPSGPKTMSRPREVSSLSQRPSGSKPRQTRASRLAGVATVNVYVSEKPRAKAHLESNPKPRRKSPSREPSRSPSPSLSILLPRKQPSPPLSAATPIPLPQSAQLASATPVGPIVTTPLLLPTRTISAPTTGPPPIVIPPALDTQPSLSRDAITTKALELLVNLVDMKQVLGNYTHLSSSTSSSAQGNSNDNNRPPDAGHLAFEGRFQNLEDRFSSVREEFKDIIGRLQDLEREAGEQRELKKVASERVLEDKGVDCRPATTTLGVETDRRDVQDVAIGNVNETAGGQDADGDVKMDASKRVLGEIAVQTEPEEEERHHSQQPEPRLGESSKGEQTPTQDVILTSVEMRTSDRNCGSETDTDSTVHIVKDDSVDPRTQEMSESLSFLVNNLVSAKMLTVVGDMLKGKARDTASVELDMSLRALSPVATPSSDSFALTNLLDEIKTLKEESRARSIREKEEMQAMRQLHSAEVDALRRRLSYLESQNTSIDPASSFVGTQHRSSSVHTIRDEAECQLSSAEAPRHVHPPRHSSSVGRNFLSTSGSGQGDIARTPSLDSISSANPRPGTSAPAERSFTFARPGHERDDELPLPIKSQRKQHISFPRSTFS